MIWILISDMAVVSHSAEETRLLGKKTAHCLSSGDVIALSGGLGSGKTEFVRGVMSALNPVQIVRSPSFSLVNTYESPRFLLHHFDFYRLSFADELFEIGFDEYVYSEAVSLIEWADMFPEVLPDQTKYIRFTQAYENVRHIESDIQLGSESK
ncbi:MAG: tRNA (adenosine(37)-N6)-threonylcarbamoyltransferase complex ATPase subunit type 1 TsaE [Fibrobacterota bacterium]